MSVDMHECTPSCQSSSRSNHWRHNENENDLKYSFNTLFLCLGKNNEHERRPRVGYYLLGTKHGEADGSIQNIQTFNWDLLCQALRMRGELWPSSGPLGDAVGAVRHAVGFSCFIERVHADMFIKVTSRSFAQHDL
jgi:hypothetical protein